MRVARQLKDVPPKTEFYKNNITTEVVVRLDKGDIDDMRSHGNSFEVPYYYKETGVLSAFKDESVVVYVEVEEVFFKDLKYGETFQTAFSDGKKWTKKRVGSSVQSFLPTTYGLCEDEKGEVVTIGYNCSVVRI